MLAIAIFKLLKAMLFCAVALAALKLLRPAEAARVADWVDTLPLGVAQRLAQRVLGWLSGLGPRRIAALGLGAFALAVLFAIEGVGLWLRRRWAGYLTVAATAALVPVELSEFFERPTIIRLLAVLLNVAIVCYLLRRLRAATSFGL